MKRILLIISLLLASCSPLHHLPSEQTIINIKDSTVLHIKDSTVIREATHYRDMAWLGDTVKIKGSHSSAYAYADTTKEAIIAGLDEDEVKEKTKIIFKDKLVEVHDTTKIEIPVEVVKEKVIKVVPGFWKFFGWLGMASLLAAIVVLLMKFKII